MCIYDCTVYYTTTAIVMVVVVLLIEIDVMTKYIVVMMMLATSGVQPTGASIVAAGLWPGQARLVVQLDARALVESGNVAASPEDDAHDGNDDNDDHDGDGDVRHGLTLCVLERCCH